MYDNQVEYISGLMDDFLSAKNREVKERAIREEIQAQLIHALVNFKPKEDITITVGELSITIRKR